MHLEDDGARVTELEPVDGVDAARPEHDPVETAAEPAVHDGGDPVVDRTGAAVPEDRSLQAAGAAHPSIPPPRRSRPHARLARLPSCRAVPPGDGQAGWRERHRVNPFRPRDATVEVWKRLRVTRRCWSASPNATSEPSARSTNAAPGGSPSGSPAGAMTVTSWRTRSRTRSW